MRSMQMYLNSVYILVIQRMANQKVLLNYKCLLVHNLYVQCGQLKDYLLCASSLQNEWELCSADCCHTRPITLSTWILTLDIFFILSLQTLQCINTECLQQHVLCLVCSTSSAPFPLVNARICRRACLTPTGSAMLKPRSANTGSNLDNYPQCSVRYLSITRPPHVSETKCLWSNS